MFHSDLSFFYLKVLKIAGAKFSWLEQTEASNISYIVPILLLTQILLKKICLIEQKLRIII